MESLEAHMEAAPEGDSDNYSEESTDYENARDADIEVRDAAPPVFAPRVVAGGGRVVKINQGQ